MAKLRQEIAQDDCWNVEALYPSFDLWKKEFESIAPNQKPSRWPEIASLKGTLDKGPEKLKSALELVFNIDRKLSKLYTYAHLKHDEDIAENRAKNAYADAFTALNSFRQEISWFEPELLALPEETIQKYLTSSVLKDYHFHLEKTFRLKAHTLPAEQELLMAMLGKALSAAPKAFNALNDADFKFPAALDAKQNEHPLTHATFSLLLRSEDRTLRKNSFLAYYQVFNSFENTLAELLSGQIETHVFNAKARGFNSSLEAALFPKNIDPAVYHALINAVHEEIGALHRYMEVRAKALKLVPLAQYDMQVPLVPDFDMQISYEEAEQLVIDSVAPLGSTYQNILRDGLKKDRWVDRYENQNKRSGAYSSGTYDSMPYILMNYKEILRNVFTLAHEAGHSMHTYMSNKHQPFHYSDYSIFVAEVASTFNEELLMRALLKKAKTREEKIFLITQKIEDIRATLFRQTQFAEFELFLHTSAEKNIALTPELLKTEYAKLNKFYHGNALELHPEASIEWARIPHFYYNFYVYQYATGISAALALADKVLNGGDKEREDYLTFLKSGESVYPLDALKIAGVDMRSVQPVKQAIQRFRELTVELEELLALNQSNLAVK